MKGLLTKDFYMLASYKKTFVLMVGILTVFTLFMGTGGSSTFLPSMLTVYLMLLSSTLFYFDDAANWNRYASALPLSATSIVGGRYLFSGLLVLAGSVLGGAFSVLLALVTGHGATIQWADLGITLAVTGGLVLVVNGLTFPFTYHFGADKARYVTIIAFIIPFVLVVGMPDLFERLMGALAAASPWMLAAGAAVVLLVEYVVSFQLSLRAFENKEF